MDERPRAASGATDDQPHTNGESLLNTDKAFAAYALILVSGVASLLTASVLVGFATLPSPGVFLEHVALGLAIRAGYKSIGGWNAADWSITGETAGEARVTAGILSSSSAAPNA